jgi:hypothetical protein
VRLHCGASQAVWRLETLPSVISEMPANGGLLRIGYRIPGSEIDCFAVEIADSLRQIFEIFPFSGDGGRRPGSIGTVWWRSSAIRSAEMTLNFCD